VSRGKKGIGRRRENLKGKGKKVFEPRVHETHPNAVKTKVRAHMGRKIGLVAKKIIDACEGMSRNIGELTPTIEGGKTVCLSGNNEKKKKKLFSVLRRGETY